MYADTEPASQFPHLLIRRIHWASFPGWTLNKSFQCHGKNVTRTTQPCLVLSHIYYFYHDVKSQVLSFSISFRGYGFVKHLFWNTIVNDKKQDKNNEK